MIAGAALVVGIEGAAAAEEGDGVYGRFRGDITLQAHAGCAFAEGGPGLALGLTGVYLSTVGVYVHYTDALGSSAPTVARSISTGVHVAPLFLIRGAVDGEHGPAFVDLLIDSLAFEIGAVWSAARPPPSSSPASPGSMPPAPSFDETPGLEAALRLDIPLIARASGPMIGVRAALRWRPSDFAPVGSTTVAERGGLISLTLGWHQVLDTHLIDPGDRVWR